jgi:hypothetical protein
MGESPLTDIGRLSVHDAKKALEYLVYEEKVDLNLADASGKTIMDWTEAMMKRSKKGTVGYKIITAIREVIRDPQLGSRRAQFSCERDGSCICVDEHPFTDSRNKNCPPTPKMIAKLGM